MRQWQEALRLRRRCLSWKKIGDLLGVHASTADQWARWALKQEVGEGYTASEEWHRWIHGRPDPNKKMPPPKLFAPYLQRLVIDCDDARDINYRNEAEFDRLRQIEAI